MKHTSLALLTTFALSLVACADIQNPVTPKAATVDRAVTTSAPATTGGPTSAIYGDIGPEMSFDIYARRLPPQGTVLHHASGGGTVLWGMGSYTYGVSARQTDESYGSAKGQVIVQYPNGDQVEGTVTCLIVEGNRAYLAGEITSAHPPSIHTFGLGLEDNGEGSKASAPDRVSPLMLPGGTPLWICYNALIVRDEFQQYGGLGWTHGNVQVK